MGQAAILTENNLRSLTGAGRGDGAALWTLAALVAI